jgi:pimeloyl-[acyl-carrier protein] methyl ester esterase
MAREASPHADRKPSAGSVRLRALLLPGLDGSGRLFAPFEAELPTDWQVVIARYSPERELDYAGLETELRADFFDGSELPTVVIAESFSGPLAIRLAASPPSSMRALVLVATFARAPVPRWLATIAAHLPRVPPAVGVRVLLTGLGAERTIVQGVREAMASLEPGVVAARLRALGEVDVREQLANVNLPMLILHARGDRLVSRSALVDERAVTRVIAGPHMLLQSRARACAEAIVAFVESSSDPPGLL